MLDTFLIIDIFIAGMLTALAVRHAYAHFRPEKHEPDHSHHSTPTNGHLPPAIRQQLLTDAQVSFHKVVAHSAAEMQKDLESTVHQLNKLLAKTGSEVVTGELTRYRDKLADLEKQAIDTVGTATSELAQQQADLQAKLAADISSEKQKLLSLIDTKLADAVASFLLETLSHNIDLGAQLPYLTSQLEEHKAELVRGLVDEAQN
ncbi:MAG TPA: hypothetical protein VFN56_04510 [Candidatus Saccharimonadales bacterium]|nr:hypothetical protein [Candidatus Saccharimonadales bacterium]